VTPVSADLLPAEYVLPLRWTDDSGLDELTRYLRSLASVVDVTVVDGSPPPVFENHARAWSGVVRHRAPDDVPTLNGKVAGVLTGVRLARHEAVVVADDDVRYTASALRTVVDLLRRFDLVRPQNYFASRSWHARWDTARSLLNRALGSDYPGTLAFRRSTLLRAGGYDGDVLFENLELIRTIRAVGGREVRADDLFVRRIAPTSRHFVSQRVRQAYDDFAQPARLALELAYLPALVWAARRPTRLALVAGGIWLLAAAGRTRAGGSRVFPATAVLWAPAWVLERGVCVWIAALARARGGVRYHGARIVRAATPEHHLRRRLAARTTPTKGSP
jgi:hypothetical protein